MFLLFVYKNKSNIRLFYTCSSLLDEFLVLPQMKSDKIKAHVFLLCNSRSSGYQPKRGLSSAVFVCSEFEDKSCFREALNKVRGGYFGLGPHLRTKRDFFLGNCF